MHHGADEGDFADWRDSAPFVDSQKLDQYIEEVCQDAGRDMNLSGRFFADTADEKQGAMLEALRFFLACPVDRDTMQRVTAEQSREARAILARIDGEAAQ